MIASYINDQKRIVVGDWNKERKHLIYNDHRLE